MKSHKEQYQELVQHIRWVIRLRWLAVAGLLVAASLLYRPTPYDFTVAVAISVAVASYNTLALLHSHFFEVRGPLVRAGELNLALNVQFALDIIVLAVLIHLTGGVESFLVPVYLVLVPAARRVLSRRATFLQASLAAAFLGMVFGLEYAGWLGHNIPTPAHESPLYANMAYVAQTLIFQAGLLYLGVYIADHAYSRLWRSLNAERQARHLALTDGLTGLYNRRHLSRLLARELTRSRRHEHSLAVLMLDLDDFKQYNDRYGHLAGDDVLCRLADLIRSLVRDSDTAFRYGGEEFTLVLPETNGRAAVALAERLRRTVEEHAFVVRGDTDVGRITISVGVATYPEEAHDVEGLIHAADVALLQAKQCKNRVCALPIWKRLYRPDPIGASTMHVAVQGTNVGGYYSAAPVGSPDPAADAAKLHGYRDPWPGFDNPGRAG